MFKSGRKLALGFAFLGVGAILVGMVLVLYKGTPDNVPGIVGAVAATIASLAGGMMTVMYGFKAEYEAKAKNGNGGQP